MPNTLEVTAFTLPLILKNLMHFGNVQVRENSRAFQKVVYKLVNKKTGNATFIQPKLICQFFRIHVNFVRFFPNFQFFF